jgi:hypothetical protein
VAWVLKFISIGGSVLNEMHSNHTIMHMSTARAYAPCALHMDGSVVAAHSNPQNIYGQYKLWNVSL